MTATEDRELAEVGSSVAALLENSKAAFIADGIPDIDTRLDRLQRLRSLISDAADDLTAAMDADFGTRPRAVSAFADISATLLELQELLLGVKKWTKTESPHPARKFFSFDQQVRHDPLGVIGVASPWNFPVYLAICPAGGALAAGNRVIMRPSSVTAKTTQVLAEYVPRYFTPEEFAVVTSQDCSGSQFAKLNFDGFFFTGSPEVGRSVARDCADNLTPVTLELGGKNPAVVDRRADVKFAADRLARSRMTNGGQICLCPDYVFVPRESVTEFCEHVLTTWRSMFPTIIGNGDYTSVVNDSNFDRIVALIDDARAKGATVRQAVPSGESLPDKASRRIAPTLVTDLNPSMDIEKTEVFGPVLSVYAYDTLDEPIAHINANEHPLTMYWYGPRNSNFSRLLDHTRSGSVNVNDFLLNPMPGTPFGGVGASGTGRYHGKYSIEAFSHSRTVAGLGGRGPISMVRMAAPPYPKVQNLVYNGLLAGAKKVWGGKRR